MDTQSCSELKCEEVFNGFSRGQSHKPDVCPVYPVWCISSLNVAKNCILQQNRAAWLTCKLTNHSPLFFLNVTTQLQPNKTCVQQTSICNSQLVRGSHFKSFKENFWTIFNHFFVSSVTVSCSKKCMFVWHWVSEIKPAEHKREWPILVVVASLMYNVQLKVQQISAEWNLNQNVARNMLMTFNTTSRMKTTYYTVPVGAIWNRAVG